MTIPLHHTGRGTPLWAPFMPERMSPNHHDATSNIVFTQEHRLHHQGRPLGGAPTDGSNAQENTNLPGVVQDLRVLLLHATPIQFPETLR